MNITRVLTVCNVFFIFVGYQFTWFNRKFTDYRIAIPVLLPFGCLLIWYLISFCEHFAESTVLTILENAAPFLFFCMRTHLFMGLKGVICILYDARHIGMLSGRFLTISATDPTKRIDYNEILMYGFLFSTLLFNIAVGIYDISELSMYLRLDLKSAMLASALFLPHFSIACALKYFCIITWTLKLEIRSIGTEIERLLDIETCSIFKNQKLSTSTTIEMQMQMTTGNQIGSAANANVNSVDLGQRCSKELNDILQKLRKLTELARKFNTTIQKQMWVLIVQNTVAMLAAAHCLLLYYISWNVFLFGVFGTVFQITFGSIFVSVFWDYTCLFGTHLLYQNEVKHLTKKLNDLLDTYTNLTKESSDVMQKITNAVQSMNPFRIFWFWKIDAPTFVIGNCLTGLAFAIFLIYDYFDDKVKFLDPVSEDSLPETINYLN